MNVTLTKQLLEKLLAEGYTYLVAENQAECDYYLFKPVDWNIEAFQNECMNTDFDDHMILSIEESSTLFFEDYLNHEVILP